MIRLTFRQVSALVLCALLLICTGCSESEPQIDEQTVSPTDAVTAEPDAGLQFTDVDEFTPDENGVYRIHSVDGLRNIASNLDASFELLCDVDCGGAEWTPIGSEEAPFTGTLNGGGFTVSNLSVGTDSAYAGFFGVNGGDLRALSITGIVVDASGAVAAGGLAGINQGSVSDCRVSGSISAKGAADLTAGGLFGVCSGGEAKSVIANVDIVISEAGRLTVGGLAGAGKSGSFSDCDAAGRIKLTGGDSVEAGLIFGSLSGASAGSCRFTGEMNTLDGKLLANMVSNGDGELTDCLWRDNSNSDEYLAESSILVRREAVEVMRAQGAIEWTPSVQLTYLCSCGGSIHQQTFLAGETYYGLPYTHKSGSLQRFEYCFNEDGTIKDWLPTLGYDGFDMYMGCDCSGAVFWAWAKVSPTVNFLWTNDMLPEADHGTLPVGDYEAYGTTDTHVIIAANDAQRMFEAYALANIGDAFVTYNDDGENHVKLCTQNAVVLRDADGVIDPDASWIVTHEQGDGLYDYKNTSWMLNRTQSFSYIYEHMYVPVTVVELLEGSQVEPKVAIDDAREGEEFMASGVVSSNYPIISSTMTIRDESGKTVWEQTVFTNVGKNESVGTDRVVRTPRREFDLSVFCGYLINMQLEPDTTYRFEASVLVSTGDNVVVKDFTFDK